MTADRFTLDPGIRALLHDLGLSVSRVLRQAQLPAGVFLSGSPSLSTVEYYRFWDAVESEGDDPDLAVRIGRSLSVEVFNPPIFAALASPDLHTAAERIAKFKPLIGPVILDVTCGRRSLKVAFHWPDGPPPPRLLVASELAFWVALARIGTRHEVYATAATMRRPYEGSEEVMAYFGTSIRKGALDTVTFATEDAARPFVTEDESMWSFFEPELRRRLSDLSASATTADRVRAALHETLPAGDSSINAVANQLILSPRTLQRQLQAEGTSYQAMLTDTREKLARRYLHDQTLTTAQIAYLLAYDDANSFYRAFRKWTGVTPDTARTGEALIKTA